GIENDRGTVTLINSTISGNAALRGSGISNSRASETTVKLTNSILAGNITRTGLPAPDCSGALIVAGPNWVGDLTGCTITGPAPLTGVPNLFLADNGGPSQTVALLPGSPAIDAGNDAICAAPPVNGVDQRGVTRPQGPHCDLGAY